MVMYDDMPDNYHEEFLPAMNISSELFIFLDIMMLTAISPKK